MDTIEDGRQEREIDDFKRELRRQVDERIDALDLRVEHLAALDADAVAGTMIAAIPTLHPFDQAAGPFYDTAGLQTWLDISRQAIDKRVRAGNLIAAQLEGGNRIYPAWQFGPTGHVHPAILPIWRTLREHSDPWTAILWLCAENPELDGQRAADWLAAGHDTSTVEAAARADAARWAA